MLQLNFVICGIHGGASGGKHMMVLIDYAINKCQLCRKMAGMIFFAWNIIFFRTIMILVNLDYGHHCLSHHLTHAFISDFPVTSHHIKYLLKIRNLMITLSITYH